MAVKSKCSFCSKSQDQVQRLIAGPNVFICDECVRLCVAILWEHIEIPGEPSAPRTVT